MSSQEASNAIHLVVASEFTQTRPVGCDSACSGTKAPSQHSLKASTFKKLQAHRTSRRGDGKLSLHDFEGLEAELDKIIEDRKKKRQANLAFKRARQALKPDSDLRVLGPCKKKIQDFGRSFSLLQIATDIIDIDKFLKNAPKKEAAVRIRINAVLFAALRIDDSENVNLQSRSNHRKLAQIELSHKLPWYTTSGHGPQPRGYLGHFLKCEDTGVPPL
ncbi:hypothetical protein N8T08_006176 [Aspergillus melleus]|uniref:Uncharacterized protein n=1 Tax=Aspergillus melleus TaxID=138277 RepID=A0ACC3B109_9EURO|nr:hypothetical protein N8T08_006176 [Aspergillus melleus]